ncbi:myosin heavy chain kinase A [Trypanosoma theileri]|uniref:Myosin heavy chain kinase A n=1 Tax=Trypanosoma theileri TaxID=67003 RepID=A0A1X0NJ27_9TRYP|nr:myosin heavy chain kinase A [Trypanosoma theileri]ORC84528.1 myosin heavy chain kinase A [Trypanosoma theileri]
MGATDFNPPQPPPPAPPAANGLPTRRPSQDVEAARKGKKCLCGAVCYVYSLRSKSWVTTECNVEIPTPLAALGKGGMRVCYEVDEIDEEGNHTACIAKFFQRNISDVVEKDYFSEAEAQCLCEEFANNFNQAPFNGSDRPRISFLQCRVVLIRARDIPEEYKKTKHGFFSYRTKDTGEVMFVMEPKLRGHFTKYNSNYGEAYADDKHYTTPSQISQRTYMFEAAEAFSHFTLVESGGSMLVCDLQGVQDFLTDPQIHSEDGRGLGLGNMGREGIERFVQRHNCNGICAALGMKPLFGLRPQADRESLQKNFYVLLRAQLQEDQVPQSKPVAEMTEEEQLQYAIRVSQVSY